MSDWIETELKLGLADVHAWQRLRDRLGPGRVACQTNYFLDVDSRSFRAAQIAIRLRAQDPDRILTAKSAKGEEDESPSAVTRRIEVESAIDPAEFDRSLREGLDLTPWIEGWRGRFANEPGVHRFLDQLATLAAEGPLALFGQFANRRETCPLTLETPTGPAAIELELDRTEYPGGRVDYEIEVEVKQASKRDGSIDLDETHRALVRWLEHDVGLRTFAVDSKLARLTAILAAQSPAAD